MPTTEESGVFRPTLILAHRDPAFVAAAAATLRPGWHVRLARTGAEVRRLARELGPAVVVLGTGGLDESGWLTCAKLRRELPEVRVLLVDPAPTPELRRFAAFVGAVRLLHEHEGACTLLHAVQGKPLPVAG
jgi:hypothetical protein